VKPLVLLWAVLVAMTPAGVANAQASGGCTQVAQRLSEAAAKINENASAYWGNRAQFVDGIFGGASSTVPNAMQAAEQNRAQGEALRAAMPSTLAGFRELVAMARSQSCLSATQLAAIVEPTIKLAKRVNFDQFPQELPESTSDTGPPQLPR